VSPKFEAEANEGLAHEHFRASELQAHSPCLEDSGQVVEFNDSRGVTRGSLDNAFRRTYRQSKGEETERTYACGVVDELERHYRLEVIPELHPQRQ
jgi:hypothetical protein